MRSISAKKIQLGTEQREEPGSEIGVQWASCLREPFVLVLHPFVVGQHERIF